MNRVLLISPDLFSDHFKEFLAGRFSEIYYFTEESTFDSFTDINVVVCRMQVCLPASFLKRNPVEMVFSVTTGVDHLDEATKLEIPIVHLDPDDVRLNAVYSSSEHALFLTMALVRESYHQRQNSIVGTDLANLKVGILGGGRIGSNLYAWLSAICLEPISVLDLDPKKCRSLTSRGALPDLDVLILAVKSNDANKGLVNRRSIVTLGSPKYLVNIARGEIVNEFDIQCLLEKGYLSGYATDVLRAENSDDEADQKFRRWIIESCNGASNMNIVYSPHVGGLTRSSVATADMIIADKIEKRYGS